LLFDENFVNKITEAINKTKGVFYWIDDFDETKATKEELKKLLNFVEKITVSKINLYGGYFSILLSYKGLNGVVHGLEYGESRDVVPVGGGIPVAKYYLPDIKKRLKAEDIIEILYAKNIESNKKFHKQICNCQKCQELDGIDLVELIQSFLGIFATTKTFKHGKTLREYPITESKINSLYHYLFVKNEEFEDIKTKELNELLQQLEKAFEDYEMHFSDNFLDYLKVWQEVLSE
jgi:hypothetical protein